MAAAGAGAGFAGQVGDHWLTKSVQGLARTLATGTASAIGNSAARSLIEGTDFGDNIRAALPDVIGNTIGEAIAGGIASRGSGGRAAHGGRHANSNGQPTIGSRLHEAYAGAMELAWDRSYGAPVGGYQLAQGRGTVASGGRTATLTWTDEYGPHSLPVGAYSSDYVVASDGESFYNKSLSGGADSRHKSYDEYISEYYAAQNASVGMDIVVITGSRTPQDILVDDIGYGVGAIVGSAVDTLHGIASAANYVLDGVGSIMFGLQEGVNWLLPGEQMNPYGGYWDRYKQTSSAVGGFVGRAFSNPAGLWNDITTGWSKAEAYAASQDNAFMGGYYDPVGKTVASVATGGVGGGRSLLRTPDLPSPPVRSLLSHSDRNRITGAGREAFIRGELARKYPGANIQNEVYLLTHNGDRAIDPLTGEGRRIDSVVIKDGRVLDSVEITGPTTNKASQILKEQRIRALGGTFVLDDQTQGLIDISNIPTRLVRIP
jgi:hypothetical protein